MERLEIPVWINVLSVVASVFIVYLLAKWEVAKEGRRAMKRAKLLSAETNLRTMEKDTAARISSREEPALKKAA